MLKSAKLRAEEQFAATQKKGKLAQKEKDKAQQVIAEKTARLRALRLAKEEADKEAVGKANTSKSAAKNN